MRFAGIDIASETHVVGIVNADGAVEVKGTPFGEDAAGYEKVLHLLGTPGDVLIAMEATGHYWKNLFAVLAAAGHSVALLNPLRTHRFASEDLARTKTDAIDALMIARFAAEKRPAPTVLPDAATEELRELVQLRERLLQDFGDRVRQLHRLVDLGFPEFTRHVRTLDSELAGAILHDYPTAAAFRGVSVKRLAALRYDGRHQVGLDLARSLIEAARRSVGQHHSATYRVQVRYACQDLNTLRSRLRDLDHHLEGKLHEHEVGRLLTTIDGIGPTTAARVIAEVGDPAHFRSAAALAAYVGAIPRLKQSGKRIATRAGLTPIGNARLRAALWMPTLTAVRYNAWLRTHYQRLRARGKLPKVALVACMHKLLLAIYSVAKRRQPFVPTPTSHTTSP
ncbi:MAG TPA: IS110 family transposase [Casimicrobiaceae bacterium]|jgi:transposase